MIKLFKALPGVKVYLDMNPNTFDNMYFKEGTYCNKLETHILAWSLQHIPGDYIELGVNTGTTAHNVCRNNPDKTIYGVDWIANTTLHYSQRQEIPTQEGIGVMCKDDRNFVLMIEDSSKVVIPESVGMVFIDGDHSYTGVKADTENVLKQVPPGTVVFWHDYHLEGTGDKKHISINKYIDTEIAPKLPIYQFINTWLIMTITQ